MTSVATRARRMEFVDDATLRPVVARPPFGSYIARLWQRRHFIVADARARVQSNTRGTNLGAIWLVLRPVLDATAYFVIFGLVMRSTRGIDNFLGYLVIGVFLFQYTSSALTTGASSVIKGRQMLRSFTFPRASLPIAAVVRESLRFTPVLVAMLLMVLVIPPFETVTWRWVLLVPVLALQATMNLGLALIAARVTAHVPDTAQIISVAIRFWLYGSAVFFSYDRFISHPTLLAVVKANPMFQVLDIARDSLLYGVTPSLTAWLVLAGWAVGLLGFGAWFFWKGEERYAVG